MFTSKKLTRREIRRRNQKRSASALYIGAALASLIPIAFLAMGVVATASSYGLL